MATVRMMGMVVVARMMVVVVAETSSSVGHGMCNGSRVHIIGVEVRVGYWKEEEEREVEVLATANVRRCLSVLLAANLRAPP